MVDGEVGDVCVGEGASVCDGGCGCGRGAFVIVPSTESDRRETDALVQGERTRGFASQVFAPDAHVADGIRDAVRWLDAQSAGFPDQAYAVVKASDVMVAVE